jgi:transcriptional regulator of NAD metabolism
MDLLKYLQKRSTPISGHNLAKTFNTESSTIRKEIQRLRAKGEPICSNRNGYFYSENVDDVRKVVQSLENRIKTQQNTLQGLIKWVGDRNGG